MGDFLKAVAPTCERPSCFVDLTPQFSSRILGHASVFDRETAPSLYGHAGPSSGGLDLPLHCSLAHVDRAVPYSHLSARRFSPGSGHLGFPQQSWLRPSFVSRERLQFLRFSFRLPDGDDGHQLLERISPSLQSARTLAICLDLPP